jgi:hypothetical protein
MALLSPTDLIPGMVILRKSRRLTLLSIRSIKDPVHVRLWFLELADVQGVVRVTCRDGGVLEVAE